MYTGHKKSFLHEIYLTWLSKKIIKNKIMAFFVLKEHERNIMPEEAERYEDETLILVAREDSVWDWKQNGIKLVSESWYQTNMKLDIHYF